MTSHKINSESKFSAELQREFEKEILSNSMAGGIGALFLLIVHAFVLIDSNAADIHPILLGALFILSILRLGVAQAARIVPVPNPYLFKVFVATVLLKGVGWGLLIGTTINLAQPDILTVTGLLLLSGISASGMLNFPESTFLLIPHVATILGIPLLAILRDAPDFKSQFIFSTIFIAYGSFLIFLGRRYSGLMRDRMISFARLQNEQAELARIQKFALLGELAAGIGHELKNPLAIVYGFAERLVVETRKPEINRLKIGHISDSLVFTAERMAKIIDAMKTFSRDAVLFENSRHDLASLIQQTLALTRNSFEDSDIQLEVGHIPAVELICSPIQLCQILSNMILNAVEASKKALVRPRVAIDFNLVDDHRIEISITDSGLGFETEAAQRFVRYQTSKANEGGLGIGLELSKTLAEAHGGRIFLDSTSRETRMVLELPIAANLGSDEGVIQAFHDSGNRIFHDV